MTTRIKKIAEVASEYDAIIFDQWGVLHDGSSPYPGAVQCLADLRVPVGVLSNSGKRAVPNAARIAAMGFDRPFDIVMTSGEALWRDINAGVIPHDRFYAIERDTGDAEDWAKGLAITLTSLKEADALLLMGLPDGSALKDWQPVLDDAQSHGRPIYCSNPDRKSPRADGVVTSPGALAFRYLEMGGAVTFYGKPHRPIFDSVSDALGTRKLLMVGDSLEHDITGSAEAGWDSVLVGGGLYAEAFAAAPWRDVIAGLSPVHAPTYFIGEVQ